MGLAAAIILVACASWEILEDWTKEYDFTPFQTQGLCLISSLYSWLIASFVSGLGFGIISEAFSLVNVIADMSGPGTIGIHGDSQYFFLASAFLTLCFVLLHTFWGIIFFNACDRKRYPLIAAVVGSHMLVSCLSLLNQRSATHSPQYLGSIIPAYIVMVIMAVGLWLM